MPEMNCNIMVITTVIHKRSYVFQILRKIICILADGIAPRFIQFYKNTLNLQKYLLDADHFFIPQYAKFNVDFKNIMYTINVPEDMLLRILKFIISTK